MAPPFITPQCRVGTTSYIVPGDVLPNVRHLAGTVDDVEVVIFESDEISNLPSPAVVAELAELARRRHLTYTIHLPLDAELGALDESARRNSVAKCLRVVERTSPLSPFAWVVHFTPKSGKRDIPPEETPAWTDALRRSARELLAAGLPASSLCVETLTFPFERIEGVVEELGLSVCLDIGHLLLRGFDVEAVCRRHWPRVRVVHLHGVSDGRDHRDISFLDPALLRMLISRLRDGVQPERVLTLEVFNAEDLSRSLDVLRGAVLWDGSR
jgi:sugar phosphate isomerase/epimerase